MTQDQAIELECEVVVCEAVSSLLSTQRLQFCPHQPGLPACLFL